ncbi:MAG TPA: tetratricopeptide repeat protein [Gaiellaceae bacterium]|nr:tetratricopeptide repeat protein [Gaiellaceae bacterium]
MTGWEVTSFDALDAIAIGDGVVWRPVRRQFDIRAFGTNAYTSEGVGKHILEEHDELGAGAGGHEELYVVVRGRATFTVGGESVDAPAGTMVFVRDPAVKRSAIAEEEDTLVLAVGGEPGSAYEVAPWEFSFGAMPALTEERYEDAIALLETGLAEHPGNASILYNLACAEALSGRTAAAIEHLTAALPGNPKYEARAKVDPDFDGIRGEPGFPV